MILKQSTSNRWFQNKRNHKTNDLTKEQMISKQMISNKRGLQNRWFKKMDNPQSRRLTQTGSKYKGS